MRRRLGLLCMLATFAGMLTWSGCSDYDEIQKVSFEDVNPEMILPIAHGKVSMEELINKSGREEGDTELIFHDDTVYLRFQFERRNPELGFLLNVPFTAPLVPSNPSITLTFDANGAYSSGDKELYFLWPMVTWLQVYSADLQSSQARLRVLATSDNPALVGQKIEFDAKDFKIPQGKLGQQIVTIGSKGSSQWSEIDAAQITSGGIYSFANHGQKGGIYKLELLDPHIKTPVAGDVELKFEIEVQSLGVKKGSVTGFPVAPDTDFKLTGTWNTKLFNKADGPTSVNQKIPGSRLVLEVQKFKGVGWEFQLDKVVADAANGPIEIRTNAGIPPTGYQTLNIGQKNVVDKDADIVKFILNDQNSNIAEIIESGAWLVSFQNFTFVPNPPSVAQEITLGDKGVGIAIYYEVPLAGTVTRDGFSKSIKVGEDVFPSSESISKYVKNEGTTKDVILHLRFINRMPVAIGMSVTFTDGSGGKVSSLDEIATVSPNDSVGDDPPLKPLRQWIAPAKVNAQGVADNSAITDVYIPLSIEQYKKIADNTRRIDLNMVMGTPDAKSDKRVKFSQEDWLKVQLGVEFTANYDQLLGTNKKKK